jgi:CheY-like chemotaxis protein
MARILVIDDEPGVRATVRKFLASEGHEILEAGDGVAALKLLGGHVAFDLIITDVYMAGMDGIELTIRLQAIPSRPAIIVMSGGGFVGVTDLLVEAGHLGATATLAKPFTVDELLSVVRDLLHARGAT